LLEFRTYSHKQAADQRHDHADQNYACGDTSIAFMAEDQLIAPLVRTYIYQHGQPRGQLRH
jgi:hypothetical protein